MAPSNQQLLPVALRALFTVAEEGLNHTAFSVHSALNQTGNTVAMAAKPYHEDIRTLGFYIGSVPYHLLIFLHGLYTAAGMRPLPFRPYWLVCFWVSLLSGYGGGTWTNLLLQEPFLWCRDDWVLPLFGIAWWIIMYSPHDFGLFLFKIPLVKMVCRCAACVLRGRVILSRVDLSVRKFSSHSIVAPLFFGTLGGCAGKITVDLALFYFNPTARPPELLYPGWFSRSAFLISAFYMTTVHWLHILPQDVAFTLVISALLAHGLMEEISGRAVDPTSPFGYAFHAMTRVPEPPPRKTRKEEIKEINGHPSVSARTLPTKTRNGEYAKKKKLH